MMKKSRKEKVLLEKKKHITQNRGKGVEVAKKENTLSRVFKKWSRGIRAGRCGKRKQTKENVEKRGG